MITMECLQKIANRSRELETVGIGKIIIGKYNPKTKTSEILTK